MGAGLLLAAALAVQAPDTATYADLATLELLQMARERHRAQDTLVHDYTAQLVTRSELRAGRSRFARMVPLWVQETSARVAWRRPNELNLAVEGVRARSVFPSENIRVGFSEPWFVPRALGDSVRLIGIPETAALHPLAADAETHYRFAITDSSVITVPGLTVRAVAVRVTPKRLGPSVVAGEMWLDRATGDVVRLSITFLGEYVWETPDGDTPADSAHARNSNKWAQRFLTVQADLEYSLVDNRYWMPWRQLLALTAHVDIIISGAMPARILTTFSDYDVNGGAPVAFAFEPDSGDDRRTVIHRPEADSLGSDSARARYGFTRTGRSADYRWEITVPPADSLRNHEWEAPLETDMTDADQARVERFMDDVARFAESLPDDWMARPTLTMAVDRVPDLFRFNRVQGITLGGGVVWRPGPAFTTVRATGGFGFSDRRPVGNVTLRREAPKGRLEVSGFRQVAEAEPWTRGLSLGNSINAVFTGHDDADYHLTLGGRASWEFYRGPLAGLTVGAAFERQRSMATESGSALNDLFGGSGVLAPNPPIAEGDWVVGRIAHRGGDAVIPGSAGVEIMTGTGGEGTGGRFWADVYLPFSLAGRTGRITVRGGQGFGDALPQLAFRLGGPQTVRGYAYGTVAARGMTAIQFDIALRRRWFLTPVLFADYGASNEPSQHLFALGGGLSFLGGWLRLNVAKGIDPDADVRFDLLFSAPR